MHSGRGIYISRLDPFPAAARPGRRASFGLNERLHRQYIAIWYPTFFWHSVPKCTLEYFSPWSASRVRPEIKYTSITATWIDRPENPNDFRLPRSAIIQRLFKIWTLGGYYLVYEIRQDFPFSIFAQSSLHSHASLPFFRAPFLPFLLSTFHPFYLSSFLTCFPSSSFLPLPFLPLFLTPSYIPNQLLFFLISF